MAFILTSGEFLMELKMRPRSLPHSFLFILHLSPYPPTLEPLFSLLVK